MLNRQIRARCRIRHVEVSLRAVCQTSPVGSGEGRWEGFGFVKSGEIAATLKQSALARVGIPDTHFFSGGGGKFLTRIADTHTFSGRGFRRVALAVASQAYPATLLLVLMTQARSDRSD